MKLKALLLATLAATEILPAQDITPVQPDAIKKWRDLMGATNPANAAEGTLRREFGDSLEANATHGSDAPETAAFEIGYFFSGLELLV